MEAAATPVAPGQRRLHRRRLSTVQHPFIRASKPRSVLRSLISDAMEIKVKRQQEAEQREQDGEDEENSVQPERPWGRQGGVRHAFWPPNAAVLQDEDEVDQGTMVRAGTVHCGTVRAADSLAGTMVQHQDTDTMLGTLVINADDQDAGTMKGELL